jgi:hypothetical protein
MQIRSLVPLGAACAVGLAAVFSGAATASGTASPTPVVSVTMTERGPAISGRKTWRPGAARIAVRSQVADQELVLLHFRPGYSYARFLADGARAQSRSAAARAALGRIFAATIFDGGVDLWRGQSASFAVTVQPGTYYLGEMTARPQFVPIQVAGASEAATTAWAAAVTATDSGYRLHQSALPKAGTITIRNVGARPHRLNLIPVKRGTTRAELGSYLRKTGARDSAPPPSFALRGPQLGTADLSAHEQMQLTYRLPAGEYALIDLNRDMASGRPEALEGMYAIATLR